MPKRITFDLDCPTSVAAGAPSPIDSFNNISIWVSGTFTATIQLQISANGTNWKALGAAITARVLRLSTEPAMFLRAKVVLFTSGTPVIRVVGQLT